MLERSETYRLTVRFSPDGVEHHPHDFEFSNPPSRQDFLDMCKQTPWTFCWNDSLLPIVAANDWPMLDYAHKGSTVDLVDANGKPCGSLQVWKTTVYRNAASSVPFITCDVIKSVTCRMNGHADAAYSLLRDRENRIQERMVNAEDYSDDRMAFEARLILHEVGLLKSKPKYRQPS